MRVAKYRRRQRACDEQIAVFVGVAESTCSTPSCSLHERDLTRSKDAFTSSASNSRPRARLFAR